jgi:hypothetical protein
MKLEDELIIIIDTGAGLYYIRENRETTIFWTAYILTLTIILVTNNPLTLEEPITSPK